MSFSKIHKNAIFNGHVDSYCLVCDSHIRSEEDIDLHIAKPIHTKNLDSTSYLEKYKDDCVRKVKKGYFCEFCNLLLSTAAKVGLHIAEPRHINRKGSLLLKRVGNSVIAYEDVVINEKAWNGLIDETCAICNTEFENEHIHKTQSAHILNLIQSKVEFGANKNIYRKIDESSFQCLTCNMVFASTSLTTHFDEQDHLNFYSAARQPNLAITSKPKNVDIEEPKNGSDNIKEQTPDDEEQTPKNKELPPRYEEQAPKYKERPPVNKESVPKEAPLFKSGFLNITENVVKIPVPQLEVPNNPSCLALPLSGKTTEKKGRSLEKGTYDLDEEICKALGARDYVALNENNKNWCILCDWTMAGSVDSHIQGKHHQTLLKMHKERLQKKTEKSVAANVEKKDTKARKQSDANIDDGNAGILDKETKPAKNVIRDVNVEAKPLPNPVLKTHEIENKSRASSVASSREPDEEAEKFAKANNLAQCRTGNKVYCRICGSTVPSSLKSMKQHIAGISHKNKEAVKMLEMRQAPKRVTLKIPMVTFIKTITELESNYIKDIIINEKFCINKYSFFTIMKVDSKYNCAACNVVLVAEQIDRHRSSPSHERAMMDSPVVISMDSEFIREVRPGSYHCGYCNTISSGDEELETHLERTSHRESKTSAAWRLQQHQADVIEQRAQKQPVNFGAGQLVRHLISNLF